METEPEGVGLIGGLRALRVESLRNLVRLSFETAASIVVLTGANGAGKTTLLEAVYLLLRGRTFRGRKAGPLVSHGAERLRILGQIETDSGEWGRLELERDGSGTSRMVDPPSWLDSGEQGFPIRLKLVGENAQLLLEGDPDLRRRFIDWNVFHVEPRFARLHSELRRVLAQRNAGIRSRGSDYRLWDAPFLSASTALDASRQAFVKEWDAEFAALCADFPFADGCEIGYTRGWPDDISLADALARSRPQERERGFTLIGPSRADFQILRDGHRQAFSRGQTKVLVTLLQLAAEQVHLKVGRSPAIFLLDDFETELDDAMVSRLWQTLCRTRSQIVCTRVGPRTHAGPLTEHRTTAVFHVEHGEARLLCESSRAL